MNPQVRWAIWCETTGKHSLPSQWFGMRTTWKSKDACDAHIEMTSRGNESWTYLSKKYPVNRREGN